MVIKEVPVVIVPSDERRHAGLRDDWLVSNEAVAGAIGGCATRLLSQPFDVLKIRFQVIYHAHLLVHFVIKFCHFFNKFSDSNRTNQEIKHKFCLQRHPARFSPHCRK